MAIRVVLNRAGVRSLLRSPEMRARMESEARKAGGNLPDVAVESFVGRNRARATLRAQTMQGRDALKQRFPR